MSLPVGSQEATCSVGSFHWSAVLFPQMVSFSIKKREIGFSEPLFLTDPWEI